MLSCKFLLILVNFNQLSLPKQKKHNTTQLLPNKCWLNCSTAAASRSTCSNSATSKMSRSATKTVSMPTVTSPYKTPAATPTSHMQHHSPQTQELISQLSNLIQLLTTLLSGNTPTNHHLPQVPMPNDNSAELLSEVSDNSP